MIEIELPQALALYSAFLGLLAAGIWLYTELSVRRPQRRLGQQFLWKCTFCGCTYLDEQAEKLSACPRCMNYNSVGEASVFEIHDDHAKPVLPARESSTQGSSRRKRKGQRTRGPRRRR